MNWCQECHCEPGRGYCAKCCQIRGLAAQKKSSSIASGISLENENKKLKLVKNTQKDGNIPVVVCMGCGVVFVDEWELYAIKSEAED